MNFLKISFLLILFPLLSGCQAALNSYAETLYDPDEVIRLDRDGYESMYKLFSMDDCAGLARSLNEPMYGQKKFAETRAILVKVMSEKNCGSSNSSAKKNDAQKASENTTSPVTTGSKNSLATKNNQKPSSSSTTVAKKASSSKAIAALQATPEKSSEFNRGWLGISVTEDMPMEVVGVLKVPEGKGLFVIDVAPGSAAEKSGMRASDVILLVDGKEFTKGSEYISYMSTLPIGHFLKLKVLRARIPIDQIIQLSEKPSSY